MTYRTLRRSTWTNVKAARPIWRLDGRRGFQRSTVKEQDDERLRILFCGADAFSVESLKALHAESKAPNSNIVSIDVVTKIDKKAGRGMKQLKSPPIKPAALELGLPVHQIDTFTGWSPPEYGMARNPYINLVIAVSFGLLIPPRILRNAKFGGLNVHPSMLPDLRGAAPIQWTIIRGRRNTGISIQTLHPSKFDEGVVLAQTPQPGLAIPNPDTVTFKELRSMLAPIGAEMLVKAIQNRLYLPPYDAVQPRAGAAGLHLSFAPKVTTQHRAVNFQTMTRIQILRRNRAIPKLFAVAERVTGTPKKNRILFETDLRASTHEEMERMPDVCRSIPNGVPFAILNESEDIYHSSAPLNINVNLEYSGRRGHIISPTITVAGHRPGAAAAAAARAKFFDEPTAVGDQRLYVFHAPLSVPEPNEAAEAGRSPPT